MYIDIDVYMSMTCGGVTCGVSGKCACTIRFPTTVWSVAITQDGDIAAGCADGNIRVFTQNEVTAPHFPLVLFYAQEGRQ
jgi:hypothetical protein